MEQKLPNGVRESMARHRDTSAHPSPDLLTAFAERNLSAAEQAEVTQHLASCADCREIVFLASPPVEEPQTVLQPAATRSWKAWIWALPSAAIVAIVSLALLHSNRQAAPPLPANDIAQTATPAAPPTTKEDTATPAAQANEQAPQRSKQEFKRELKTSPTRVAPESKALAELRSESVPATAKEKDNNIGVVGGLISAAPVPRDAQPAAAAAPAPAPQRADAATKKAEAADTLTTAQVAPPPPVQSRASAATVAAESNKPSFGYTGAAPMLAKVSRPQWRITPEGHLEQKVGSDWNRVLAEQPVEFRVVSVNGNEVWAAGTHGAIFRSFDAGATWIKVAVEGVTATVTSIHFNDGSHGVMRLESGEQWTTDDGGNNWKKKS